MEKYNNLKNYGLILAVLAIFSLLFFHLYFPYDTYEVYVQILVDVLLSLLILLALFMLFYAHYLKKELIAKNEFKSNFDAKKADKALSRLIIVISIIFSIAGLFLLILGILRAPYISDALKNSLYIIGGILLSLGILIIVIKIIFIFVKSKK